MRKERLMATDPIVSLGGLVVDQTTDLICLPCRASVALSAHPTLGSRKMISHVVVFESPVSKVYSVLPPPKDELDEVLAVIFTRPSSPTEADMKRTPLLDIEVSMENLAMYTDGQAPVAVIYKDRQSNKVPEGTSVFDNDDADSTTHSPCPVVMHGLVGECLDTLPIKTQKTMAARHFKANHGVLTVGHAESPESIYNNPTLYPSMFPWLFPLVMSGSGQAGFFGLGPSFEGSGLYKVLGSVGTTDLSDKAHKKWLLMYHDKWFQTDVAFPFVAFSHEQIKASTMGRFLFASKDKFFDISERLLWVDDKVLEPLSDRMRAGETVVPATPAEKDCFQLINDLDHVAYKVQGSLTSKKYMRNEAYSLMAAEGAPSWYFTMAPSDHSHPICVYWAGNTVEFDLVLLEERDRVCAITSNPVAAARFFNFMVNLFIQHVLRPGDVALSGLFGDTAAYYGTVEQQGRLTLHIHMIIWLYNSLSPQQVKDRLLAGDSIFHQELIAYLDNTWPDRTLKGNTNAKGCKDNKWKRCKARFPHKIVETSNVDDNSHINLKKSEQWINMYASLISYIFRCNTDVTSLHSGTAIKAVLIYITDYITKPGLKIHAIFDCIRSIFQRSHDQPDDPQRCHKDRARKLMTQMVNMLAEACNYWKVDGESLDDVKITLKKGRDNVVGISPVEDYIHHPTQLEDLSLYDWISLYGFIVPSDHDDDVPLDYGNHTDLDTVTSDRSGRVKYIPHDTDITGQQVKKKKKDLKADKDTTWDAAFEAYSFSETHSHIIANLNLRYECLDVRDDYRAELIQEAEAEIPAWMDGNTYLELTADGDQQLVLEDMTEYGIDPDLLSNKNKHGRHHKMRERQATVIRNLMGPARCKWSAVDPRIASIKHNEPLSEQVADRSPSDWKAAVDRTKADLLESRRTQDVAVQQSKPKCSQHYIDQVEVVRKCHLMHSQHDDTEELVVSWVKEEYVLNEEQQRAFRIVTQHADNPATDQLTMYIGGMGGTGKMRVLNTLTAYFKHQGESRCLVIVAPTGTAAASVKGSTYHFMFGINECHGETMSKKVLAEFKERLDGVDYIFLDEVSMLSPNEGLFATSKKAQELAMGKAIWHQVTTVVILRQNMRQTSQTPNNEKLRTVLSNMRYKACTKSNIAFLNSRVSGRSTAPKISDVQFRNVSIITGLNVHKDEFNRLASARFAEETGATLTMFYSEDQLSSSESSDRTVPVSPSENDKHISPALALFVGPGSDGTFLARHHRFPWSECYQFCSYRWLIHLLSLPDDTHIRISRSQVEVLHNFAMTDYSSQGTLILPSLNGTRSLPIDAGKIQGGCSGYLRQEFRELETLNDITTQIYNGSVPVTVQGNTCYALIESFHEHVGNNYSPPLMDRALIWSEVDPFESSDATLGMGEWAKSLITHKPNIRTQLPVPSPVVISSSVPASGKRIFTPMKPSEKRKGRVSDTFDLKQDTVDKHIAVNNTTTPRSTEVASLLSCWWSNNSCAYDVAVYVLYNTWRTAAQGYKDALCDFENPWLNILVTSFTRHVNGQYTLEEVRDYFRRRLNRAFPTSFVFGRETSAEAVMLKWCSGTIAFDSIHYTCSNGHDIMQSSKMSCVLEPGGHDTRSLQQFIKKCKARPIARAVVSCSVCTSDVVESHKYMYAPPLLNVAFTTVSPDLNISIEVNGTAVLYIAKT
ncbi:hypothetical protein EDD85DRAFT_791055 [Armillaria nabsnona]|nr:hypothetical protein EDD85DRAFT_791055 [Armillaria nabsnona]